MERTMWHWDQGRLAYFQFDVLRRAAHFCLHNDFAKASRSELQAAIGLNFNAGPNAPWRNYARIFKAMYIMAGVNGTAVPTAIAERLAVPGNVTADEYFHFVIQATTEPSPALSGYRFDAAFRYPLLFALRYILVKATQGLIITSFDEIIGGYSKSGFIGTEDDTAFITLLGNENEFADHGKETNGDLRRQARESLQRTVCQVSYLHLQNQSISASIHSSDAKAAFDELYGISGPFLPDADQEILRRASLFKDGSVLDFFDYPRTVVSDLVQAGFEEGRRVERTHLVIERNAGLRREYFSRFDPRQCDMCRLDTKATYPWTNSILDLHHKLPLAAGTQVEAKGTVLSDLAPVCPTCHRAIHRFYSTWLSDSGLKDFENNDQAHHVYNLVKTNFSGHRYAR
jgi:hypothetical protein